MCRVVRCVNFACASFASVLVLLLHFTSIFCSALLTLNLSHYSVVLCDCLNI